MLPPPPLLCSVSELGSRCRLLKHHESFPSTPKFPEQQSTAKLPPAAAVWEQEQQNPDLPQSFSTHQVLLNVLICVHIRVGRFEVGL